MRGGDIKTKKARQYLKQFLTQTYQDNCIVVRPKFLCFFLISIQFVQRLSLIFCQQLLKAIMLNDQQTNTISQQTFEYVSYSQIQNTIHPANLSLFLLLFLVINGIFIVNIACSQILRIFKFKNKLLLHYISIIKIINTYILKIYYYSIFIPSVFISSQIIYENTSSYYIISWLNLSFTFGIGILSSILDFSQDFVTRDYLHRKQSSWNTILLIADATFCIISQLDSKEVQILWGVLLSLISITQFFVEQHYFNQCMNKLSLIYQFNIFIISIITLVYFLIYKYCEWFILFLTCIPLAVKIATCLYHAFISSLIENSLSKANNFNQLSALTFMQFENLIHSIHSDTHFYEDYVLSKTGKGILIETLMVAHIKSCSNSSCFCIQLNKIKEQGYEDFFGENIRKKYVNSYIMLLFEKYFESMKKVDSIRMKILQITFLLEANQYPIKCFTQIIECYKSTEQYNWKHRCLIDDLKSRIEFYIESKINHLDNQKMDSLICIEFDELITDVENDFRVAIPMYREYLNYISQDFIDLEELQKVGISYLKERDKIERKLRLCYHLNGDNKYLSTLTYVYIDFLDFKQRRQKDFKKISIVSKSIVQKKQKHQGEQCIIFISLLKPIGKVLKFSHNFPVLLEYQSADILNKSLNTILPQDVSRYHNNILSNFIEQFLISVDLRLKLDYVGVDSELGISGQVRREYENVDYITFHQSGKISETTEGIYKTLFLENLGIPQEKVSSIDLYKILPQLGIKQLKNKKQDLDTSFKFYFVFPGQDLSNKIGFYAKRSMEKIKSSLYNAISDYDSQNCTIFEADIELKITKVSAVNDQFNYVCVNNIKKIRNKSEKYNVITRLQNQAEEMLYNNQNIEKINSQKNKINGSINSFQSKFSKHSTKYFQIQNQNQYDEKLIIDLKEHLNMDKSLISSSYVDYFDDAEDENQDPSYQENRHTENKDEVNQEDNSLQENVHNQPNHTDQLEQKQQILYSKYDYQTFNDDSKQLKNQSNFSMAQNQEQKKTEDYSHGSDLMGEEKRCIIDNEISSKRLAQNNENDATSQNKAVKQRINSQNRKKQQKESQSKNDQLYKGLQELSFGTFDNGAEISTDRNLLNGQTTRHNQEVLQQDMNPKLQAINYSKCSEEDSSRRIANAVAHKISELNTEIMISEQIFAKQVMSEKPNNEQEFQGIEKQLAKGKGKKKVKKQKEKQQLSQYMSQRTKDDQQRKAQQNNIASSVNSTRTANFQRKHEIIKQILIRKQNKFIDIINYIGVFSLAILITVSTILFTNILALFSEEQAAFIDIPYAVSIRADYSLIIQNKELEVMLDNNLFNFSADKLPQVDALYQGTHDDDLDKFNHYRNQVMAYYRDTKSNGYKDYMLNTTQVLKNYGTNGTYVNHTYSLPYAFLFIEENLYQYMLNGVHQSSSYNNIQQNFIAMFAQYANIQTVVVNQAYSLSDQIISLLYMTLYIITTISFIFIFIIYPIYYTIQTQREQVLKLNSTFDPSKLEQLIEGLDVLIQQGNILQQTVKRKVNNVAVKDVLNTSTGRKQYQQQQQQQSKKKMLSSTTTLKKFNTILIIIGVMVFSLLTIYPIVNLIVIQDFINEGKLNIGELSSLYSVRAQLTSNYAANYMAMSGSLIPGKLDTTKYNRVHSLAATNQSKLQGIINIFNDFTNSRHDQAKYNGFFLKILKENICDAFQNYPQYITAQNAIDIASCRTISNHLLENGLYVSLKYVFNKFEEVLPYYDKISVDGFRSDMQNWVSQFDFFEFNVLYRDLIKVIESLRYFMLSVTSDYFSYVIQVTYGLFFYSIVCLLLVFYFCWFTFLQQISQSLTMTRKILTVVGVGYIIENPYIMSFLSKENKK